MLEKNDKELKAVIFLDVKDELLIERCTGRRIHPGSGRTYHIKYNKPKIEGKDDITGEPLIQRDDDKEETIKKRLKTFHDQTAAILAHYDAKKLIHKIDGNREIGIITKEIDEILKSISTAGIEAAAAKITEKPAEKADDASAKSPVTQPASK